MLADAKLLDGKVAIITGAGSGFGAATAELFAQQGASVVIADVTDEWGEAVASQINTAGGEASFRHTNVRSREDVDGTVAFAEEHYGRLDIMISNAGILGSASFRASETVSEEDWLEVIDINLHGAFRCFRAAIPAIRRSGGGALSATSSVAGVFAVLHRIAYSSSKGALNAMIRSLSVELAPDRIRANAVAPGGQRTGVQRQSRMGHFMGGRSQEEMAPYRPPDTSWKSRMRSQTEDGIDDVAKAHLYLCSQLGDFISGQTLVVDGGFSIWNGT